MPSKMYDYIITLKHPDYKWIDRVSMLLCLISALLFVYFIVGTQYKIVTNYAVIYIVAIVIIAGQLVFNYINRHTHLTNNRIAFLAIAVTWVLSGNNWLAALYLFAAILEPRIKFPEEIGVDKNGITKNNLFNKSYSWQELNNIILKDDILTIDFKNNSIFQKETEQEVDIITENEFNEFCKIQLSTQKTEPLLSDN